MCIEQITNSFISGTLSNLSKLSLSLSLVHFQTDDGFRKFHKIRYGRFCNFLMLVFLIEYLLFIRQTQYNKFYMKISWSECNFWPDCKAISAYGLMMSVCPSVCLSVRPSFRLSVRLSTFWLTSVFKFVLGHIYQYRLDTFHGNRPWWDLLNCDLSLWPRPSLFQFKVT